MSRTKVGGCESEMREGEGGRENEECWGVADESKSKQRTGEEGGWDGGSVKWGSRSGMFRHKLSPGNNITFFFLYKTAVKSMFIFIFIHKFIGLSMFFQWACVEIIRQILAAISIGGTCNRGQDYPENLSGKMV